MSRINTNVSSLIAQRVLRKNNESLNKSLERLSTGLRINKGADDPAGLIASENLRAREGRHRPGDRQRRARQQHHRHRRGWPDRGQHAADRAPAAGQPGGQHRRPLRRGERGQPAPGRLDPGHDQPHRRLDRLPGRQAAERQLRLHHQRRGRQRVHHDADQRGPAARRAGGQRRRAGDRQRHDRPGDLHRRRHRRGATR